jgi:mono/diheme cytochrome c family protein/cytochrome bd-type quinol oxidase subunit 1
VNYPVWYLPSIGGAIIIAFVAIVHVVVSHFAVGGGLWLVLTEKKAYREKKEFILEYVKKHTLFFMLLTMVFGSMTGVGIWFTISLISPDATSVLIHTFVFGWAIEWVFFVIEILTAFLYFYTFRKISEKTHLLIGWIYFLAALASLFVINAILSFMLTPGQWLETKSFWHGILNPTYLPSTVFRTFLSFALAGGYALLTAARKYKGAERSELVAYNGKWIFYSMLGMIPSLIWYFLSLPELTRQGLKGTSFIMVHSMYFLVIGLIIFLLLTLFFTLWKSKKLNFTWSLVVLISIFIFFSAFEFIREAGRKPFIIRNYMYSSGLKVADIEKLEGKSILNHSKWVQNKEINEHNILSAGEEIFMIQCYACHTLGFKNNILPGLKNWNEKRISTVLKNLKGITPFMPPFIGTEQERGALAKWLYSKAPKDGEFVKEGSLPLPAQGERIFKQQCSLCHEIDDPEGILPRLLQYQSIDEITNILGKLDSLNEDMPAFEGNDQEKKALAEYLFKLRAEEKKDD